MFSIINADDAYLRLDRPETFNGQNVASQQ
jgi:hypothetical protein